MSARSHASSASRWRWSTLSLGLLVASVSGCFSPAAPAPTAGNRSQSKTGTAEASAGTGPTLFFTDQTAQSGINFVPTNGQQSGHLAIVETLGVGVALLDFDSDDCLDAFAPGGGEFVDGPALRGRPAGLFRQSDSWKFTAIDAARSGIDLTELYAHGAIAGDYNNDALVDLLVTGYGGLRLFANMGDGTFQEGAAGAGLVDAAWSTGAAWGDVNGDGALD
ncbi:MAG TPA: VCBS repeat-containing protein, partial [Planctomycetaceae bacterium]|nr:VCBS repeat-containing protein [Planctomycetaceae bacterium]